jgi:Icc protein
MKVKLTLTLALFFIGAIFFLSGCGSSVSGPDQVTLDEGETNLTQKNLEKISKINLDDPDKFSFVIVADSHTDYDHFRDIIADINKNPEPSFLIHAGDFTDLGILNQYRRTRDILTELTIPYVTAIGNHDCWTNGKQIYEKMFGDFNYSFVFGDYKFIFLDANILANGGEPPDFDWLENELSDHDLYNLIFPIVHIPPFDFTWSDEMENRYKQLMVENNISLSIHGHKHYYWYGERYDDGVKYLVVDDVGDRSYCIISIDSTVFNVENIILDK